MKWLALLIALVPGGRALAQVEPTPTADDPRVAIAAYVPNQIIRLQVSPDRDLTLLFPPGEHITSVRVGDTSAYQIRVAAAADSISVRATRPAASSAMLVRTEQRRYELILSGGLAVASPYVVRFTDARAAPRIFAPPAMVPQAAGPMGAGTKAQGRAIAAFFRRTSVAPSFR